MRFSVVLALAMAGLTMTAAAQKFDKPTRTKPSHHEEKEGNKKSRAVAKEPANKNSPAQELRRAEQSSARSSVKKSGTGKAARTNPALKAQKKESNPPIHFASTSGSKGDGKRKAGDPYKGRLRHKGSH
ncbi:MAG TPA: hypothetical protein VNW47_03650 [Terriglobales bacterium]|jgi:hypothetical protein|nr:hypothetical protein [Terriglobales bacterium]